MSRRDAVASRRRTSASTASANASSGVTSRAGESTPCSAWVIEVRGDRRRVGRSRPRARGPPMDRPAGRCATSPTSSTLAAVTHALPGPDDEIGRRQALVREPEGEGADRLDAARDEQPVDAEQPGRAEQDGVDVAVRGRRARRRRSAATPATCAGTTRHHQRRRVRRGAPRHVRARARRPAASGARARPPGRSSCASTAGRWVSANRRTLAIAVSSADRCAAGSASAAAASSARVSSSRPSGRPPPNRAAASRTADSAPLAHVGQDPARRLAHGGIGHGAAPEQGVALGHGGRVGRPEVEPPESQLGVDAVTVTGGSSRSAARGSRTRRRP